MTRALVTGADGFVGTHVVVFLAETTDWHVRLFDVRDEWRQVKPTDVVISLAATADPVEALRDPAAAYVNDVRIMVETLEFARKVGARVLHVSTNEVYGPGRSLPYRPRGPYAGGKACQEVICETYQDVPVTIVVTQSLFGERQQPNKLVPTAVRSLLADEPVPLQCNGSGWATRPFLHVRNLAEALVVLAQNGNGQRRVHVGAQEAMSVHDAVTVLAGALGREPRIERVDAGDRAGHELNVESIGCDVAGWRPSYLASRALEDVAHWYVENPEWLRCAGRS